ncbi:MAG: glycosyltransferase family 2 protein [Candidatus Limnocylindrales bacterium]|jgi:glycosyltransferase involved in cell wall biosynthesis
MRISIVTPVLNGMPWLPETVASVARQRKDVDVEHLIRDGGSTDGSREWLAAHAELGYKCALERDSGQTDALAAGFDQATGDVLGWLNADDILEPGALKKVVEAFEAHPEAVIVSGSCLHIGPGGEILGAIPTPPRPEFDRLLRYPTNLAQPATFFRAEAYRRVGGLDRRYNLAMDVDLWFRLARIGDVVLLRDVVLARFRLHPNAKSVVAAAAASREDLSIRRTHGMPLTSPAGRALVRHGFLDPVLAWPKRTAKRVLRANRPD